MRAVVDVGDGELELNYLWLPTVVGMNANLKRSMEKELSEQLRNVPMDEAGLDKAHDLVVDYIAKKFPLGGIVDYLNGMKHLEP